MRKAFLILLLCSTILNVSAQKISFETLDTVSALVSQWQYRTSGKTFRDASGDEFELSFPPENFKVWYHDKLATRAVYKKRGNREVLSVTEGIDFSKATAVTVGDDQNGITCVSVHFPKDHLKTQLVENGKVTATVRESRLEFFCPYGVVDSDRKFLFDKMFFGLYGLAVQLKMDKGLMQVDALWNELSDWEKLGAEAFAATYPNSLLALQAKDIATRQQAEAEALARNRKVIQSYAEQYRYQRGLHVDAFTGYNREAARIVKKGNYKSYGNSAAYSAIKGLGNPYPEGPLVLGLQSAGNDIVTSMEYVVYSEKNEQQATARFQAILADLQNRLDQRYISKDGEHYKVTVPGVPTMTLRHISYNKWHAISLLFE